MPNYSKMTDKVNNRKIQVESAVRDGEGNKISTRYITSDGYYPQLGAGFADLADNLTPYSDNSVIPQKHPFVFQSSGKGSDTGSYSLLKELRGNTIVWNQLINQYVSGTYHGVVVSNSDNVVSMQGTVSTTEQTADITIGRSSSIYPQNGHKYIYKIKGTIPEGCSILNNLNGWQTSTEKELLVSCLETQNTVASLRLRCPNGTVIDTSFNNIQIFDLTTMFGVGNEPTSVVEFNRLFPLPYYSSSNYQLLSSKSNKLINVGLNAFDIDNPTNFIKVIAGETYSIENTTGGSISEYDDLQTLIKTTNVSSLSVAESGTPYIILTDNTHYVKINDYTSTTCLHLTWGNERDGEFEEYVKNEYDLPDIELRSAGSVYDSITPNGTYTKRLEIVNLGELDWYYVSANTRFYSNGIESYVKPSSTSETPNILCSKYERIRSYYIYDESADKVISIDSSGNILIRDTNYTDADTLKASLSDVYLIYELNAPVITQVNSFTERQDINDFGTQEFVSSQAIQVPQGNLFSYPVDYKAFIDSLGSREDIDYDASKIVSHEELTEALSHIDLSDYATLDAIGFSKINAPSSTTLTNEIRDIIVNGCIVNGTFLTYDNIVFFPALLYSGVYYGTYYVGGRPSRIGTYQINASNVISLTSDKNLRLEGIDRINGKAIPNYPSNTGTFVLKCVNGTLTWVQE